MKFLLFLCLSVLVLSSCKEDDSPVQPTIQKVDVTMKLKVGSKWIYQNTNFKDGNPVNATKETIEILSSHEYTHLGKKLTLFVTEDDAHFENGFYETPEATFMYQLSKLGDKTFKGNEQFKRYLGDGQIVIKQGSSKVGDMAMKVIDINSKYSCKGKTYSCVKTTITKEKDKAFIAEIYLTKNIGNLASHLYMVDPTTNANVKTRSRELVSYQK